MLQFPAEFFEREEKGGFLVGEVLKKAWAVQLGILHEIDTICAKYGLKYFAYWGTLIGAVRHQGFIPWDDDLDIAMPRPDYMKFLEVVMDELSDEYFMINNYVSEWENSFSRIVKGKALYLDKTKLDENYNCPFALGIDIFPLDYISRNKQEAEEQRNLMIMIGTLITAVGERKKAEEANEPLKIINEYNMSIATSLVTLEKMCGVRFEGDISLLKQLNILYDQIAALFTEEESDYLTDFPCYLKRGYKVKKEWFQTVERVPFENITIPIPSGYDGILRSTYGDYTVPVKNGSTHGDLYFRQQIQILADKLDFWTKEDIAEEKQLEMIEELKQSECETAGEVKYIFICNDTYETVANDTKVVEKLRKVFEQFEGKDDIRIWWRPGRIDLPEMYVMEGLAPNLVKEYRELIESFQAKKMGFFDPGLNIDYALEHCCAYYGVENKISKLFQLSGKPVMIMNFSIE